MIIFMPVITNESTARACKGSQPDHLIIFLCLFKAWFINMVAGNYEVKTCSMNKDTEVDSSGKFCKFPDV